jgi:hypothetical protein
MSLYLAKWKKDGASCIYYSEKSQYKSRKSSHNIKNKLPRVSIRIYFKIDGN